MSPNGDKSASEKYRPALGLVLGVRFGFKRARIELIALQ
jgi:hypothetical protein